MAESESAESLEAKMDEPQSTDLVRAETWGPPPTMERWKKFCPHQLPDQMEYFDPDPRLSLSEDLEVGYFKTDRATQTDVTEVLEIRELSNTTHKLAKLTGLLQRDFKYLKTYLEMQFEDRLKEECTKLYKKLQMIIQEIVALHEKNEDTMRKSFYKQLCDAIASIRGAYSQFFEVDEEIAKLSTANVNLFRKKLKDKNDLIRELQEQVASYKDHELFRLESIKEEHTEKITHLEREISELRRENDKLTKSTVGLEEDLQLCEKANTLLEGELSAMKQRMEKDQKMIQKLTLMKDKLSEEIDEERRTVQDMYDQEKEDMEETRRLLETESIGSVRSFRGIPKSYYEERAAVHRIPSVTQMRKLRQTGLSDLPRVPQLSRFGQKETPLPGFMKPGIPGAKMEQRKSEKDDVIWREGVDSKQTLELQVRKLKKILELQRKHIKSLQVEADQESKMWERKCLILRNSLHALKDEMFTRQSFVRQFVPLSDTSFNYNKAKPLYIQPKNVQGGKKKTFQPTILPRLESSNHSQTSDDFLFLSMPTTSRDEGIEAEVK
ncbi:uncharacterized protein C10orf67 homolog, mitochondrial isoform X2 [Notamacropus eugenii]|uniref:uncharacterized protein C10orf67 homolog, mitochondrial isoform X2 n=1 Tax=Notamacropus eugenii TaxID=9315 RepID=UPI003B66F335